MARPQFAKIIVQNDWQTSPQILQKIAGVEVTIFHPNPTAQNLGFAINALSGDGVIEGIEIMNHWNLF